MRYPSAALAAVLGLAASACSSKSSGSGAPCEDGDATRLGAIISLTGPLAPFGPAIDASVDVAASEINAQGGVLGKPLCIVHADDGTDEVRARAKAEELVADAKVVGVLGGLSSGSSKAIREVTGAANLMQISCCSTSAELSGTDNFFRTAPSDALQAVVLAKRAKEAGYLRVAVIYLEGPYGQPLVESFRANFVDANHSIESEERYVADQLSYRELVDRTLTHAFDAVLLIAYPGDGVKIVNDVRDAMTEPPRWLFTEGLRSDEFLDNLGAAKPYVEGAIGTAPAASEDPLDRARAGAFLGAYNAFSGGSEESPPFFTDTSYDTVYLAAAAIERAGAADRALALAGVIEVSRGGEAFGPGEWAKARSLFAAGTDVDYQGASGRVDLDAAGDLSNATYEVWTVDDGKIARMQLETP